MNRIISMFLLGSIMMGCSTAYRSGQTPDDVYFSPTKENSGYVQFNNRDEEYRADEVPMTDRYLRMKTFGGSRWNMFDDDFAYWNNPHWNNNTYFNVYPSIGYGMGYGNAMWGNPFAYRNSGFWNPFSPNYYGRPVVVYNVYNINKYTTPRSSGPRTYNLNTYTAPRNVYSDPKLGTNIRSGNQYYNNSSSGTPRGGYNPRSSGSDYGSPARTFSNSSSSGSSSNRSSGSTSSSSSSSSSGSSSSGSAPVRSFPRGGN
jgi:uncharacterized membrane protein YgcG